MTEKRKVEIMIAGVGWVPVSFADVSEGDHFRLFEEDGTPVEDNDGNTEFFAVKDAYQVKSGAWCLETDDYKG